MSKKQYGWQVKAVWTLMVLTVVGAYGLHTFWGVGILESLIASGCVCDLTLCMLFSKKGENISG